MTQAKRAHSLWVSGQIVGVFVGIAVGINQSFTAGLLSAVVVMMLADIRHILMLIDTRLGESE